MKTHHTSGSVEVDGDIYLWTLRRQPRPLAGGRWEGLALTLRHQDFKREAIVQFPPPVKPNGRPDTDRQQVDLDHVRNAVAAAIEAGWEPTSRGKPVEFEVDAEGR